MNIGCFLLVYGKFEKAVLPEELLIELSKSLREKGKEMVHFEDKSVEVEGVYVPAKGSKISLLPLSMEE